MALIGKWHLGEEHQYHPNERGFDYFYGFLGGGHNYFTSQYLDAHANGNKWDYNRPLSENLELADEPRDVYLTDWFSQKGVEYINKSEEQDEDPFLLFMYYNTPHSILEAKEEDKKTLEEKPNIVLLFVDDYGWSDVGYRNDSFETPNLDKLKIEGLDFERAYIPTPTCSPIRLSLLTRKEAVRLQMLRHIHLDPKNPDAKYGMWPTDPVQMPSLNYLPLEEITYAERLKEFGYYNMFIGKWHLGHDGRYPIDQGFDQEFGVTDHWVSKNLLLPVF